MKMDDFLPVFLEEASDMLDEWERCCLDLDSGYNKEFFNQLFRAAHNLKGASRSVNLIKFCELVHKSEDLITALRDQIVNCDAQYLKILLESHRILFEWRENLLDDPLFIHNDFAKQCTNLFSVLKNIDVKEEAAKDIGSILVEQGAASFADIKKARTLQDRKIGEILVDEKMVSQESVDLALSVQIKKNSNAEKNESLRISANKIDYLMQFVGELSTNLSIIVAANSSNTLTSQASINAIHICGKVIKDLQNEAVSLRMQPLQRLFQRLERVAKDVARSKKINIQVVMDGEFTELDKTVTEKIIDPLSHIIRNAVDHGIESDYQERVKLGKSEIGSIFLLAKHEAGRVIITVADDGRGLDPKKIKAKAVEKGIISQDTELSRDEINQLILRPGFSTAEKITDISGRGVGMDIVSQAIKGVGGTLHIASEFTKGSTFEISLPTNLSIIESFIVLVGKVKYAVPIQDVSEIIDLNAQTIQTSGGDSSMINLRGNIVPIQMLSQYLMLNDTSEKEVFYEHRPALVSEVSNNKFVAFEVNAVIGRQSVVIRNLSGEMGKIPGINGSTILSNGEPGYIVPLSELARSYSDNLEVG